MASLDGISTGQAVAFYLETYGCQMNLADSEVIRGVLAGQGFRPVDTPDCADVILLNTCAIREHAEQRVAQKVRQLIAARRDPSRVRIGLTGCMVQHHRDRLLERIPGLDFIVGPDGYRRLPELLRAERPIAETHLDRRETYEDISPHRAAGVRAWLTIMRGCDRFCTFCVVPYVRGRERSIPAPVIVEELRRIAGGGYREVVLLGQTVNAYHHDGVNFGDLLRMCDRIEGIERIRFTSPHPADMDEATIVAMAECDKVAPYVHLPIQSGSDRILRAMERGHTIDQYRCLVERMRASIAGLALSTDVIVGYPGETDADFDATAQLMEEIGYHHAFLFKYSRREGTRAFSLGDTVEEKEKSRRLEQLIQEQEKRAARIHRTLVGTVTDVLVEGPAKHPPGWLYGKNPQFKTVVFQATNAVVGEMVAVLIEATTSHTLKGRQAA